MNVAHEGQRLGTDIDERSDITQASRCCLGMFHHHRLADRNAAALFPAERQNGSILNTARMSGVRIR